MRPLLVFPLALAGVFLASGPAAAFDFGFVRVPMWMDPWILGLAVGMVPFWLLAVVTKPRHIAFKDIYRNYGAVSSITRMAHRTTAAIFVALMAMLFLGMGLQRYAEATVG